MAGYAYKPMKACDRYLEVKGNKGSRGTADSQASPTLPPHYQRTHDERIRRERERVALELECLSAGSSEAERKYRGTVQGDALKHCHYCHRETVETFGVLRRMGWVMLKRRGNPVWCCVRCKRKDKHKEH